RRHVDLRRHRTHARLPLRPDAHSGSRWDHGVLGKPGLDAAHGHRAEGPLGLGRHPCWWRVLQALRHPSHVRLHRYSAPLDAGGHPGSVADWTAPASITTPFPVIEAGASAPRRQTGRSRSPVSSPVSEAAFFLPLNALLTFRASSVNPKFDTR